MKRARFLCSTRPALLGLVASAALLLGSPAALLGVSGLPLPEVDYDRQQGVWEGLVAFRNVNVITMVPGEKPRLKKRTVIVRDGLIEEIGKTKRVEIPDEARVIEGKRKYLLPGLIDSHAHFWIADGRFDDFDEKDLYTLFLANGVTSIYEMVGADLNNRVRSFLFDWREEVASGRAVGPQIFLASPRFRDEYMPDNAAIDAAVKQFADLGYDSIKVHAPNRLPNYLRLFEQAKKHDIKPIGHPPYRSTDVPVDVVLDHQSMVAHTHLLMYQYNRQVGNVSMTESEMKRLARQVADAGTVFQPTPATMRIFYYHLVDGFWNRLAKSPWLSYFPPQVQASWVEDNDLRNGPNQNVAGTKLFWEAILEMTRELYRAGVPFIAGSDAGGIDMTPYGFFFHEELRSLNREVGMTPWETLATATRNNAAFVEMEDSLGTVEVGKRADLLLVDKNPLKKIKNLQKIAGVMVRGHWIDEQALDAALADLAGRMARRKSRRAEAATPVPMERDLECHGPSLFPGMQLGG